jgi:hypothetical protein
MPPRVELKGADKLVVVVAAVAAEVAVLIL